MRVLVTGAAGFIGSNLCRQLCTDGHSVVGLDCFTDYYSASLKRRNLLQIEGDFALIEESIASANLPAILSEVEVVYHLAGQPGVRGSWGAGFKDYLTNNVEATQSLLEACRGDKGIRVVYASSSSVYGNAPSYPTSEKQFVQPYSPYGVSKLAAEQLCGVYSSNLGLPVSSVRYFTVYGPGQRPDMAIGRLIRAGLTGKPFQMFGSGDQIRDFTFVEDAVEATQLAAGGDIETGSIFNVGGGSACSMLELVAIVEELINRSISIEWRPGEPGDAFRTGADITLAANVLGWKPKVPLKEGIARQIEFERSVLFS